MDTLTSTGSGTIPPEASPNPKRRRRSPLIALATVLILLAGFGAYAGWFLSNYQPLTGGSGFYGVSAHGARELHDVTSPEGDTFDEWKIPFAPGGTASYTFTLLNEGPLPVTITAIGKNPTPQDPVFVL